MNKKLMFLIFCLLSALLLACGALAEEAAEPAHPSYTYSVTYVEKDASFTEGTTEAISGLFSSHQFTAASPQSSESFLGWSTLPNGLTDYLPGDLITTMGANPHAILYAVYSDEGANRFVVQYVTNGHYRVRHYLSDNTVYEAIVEDGYAEGFEGWSLSPGGTAVYQTGDSLMLNPAEVVETAVPTYSGDGGDDSKVATIKSVKEPSITLYAVIKENAPFLFTVHYECGNGTESVTLASSPGNPVIQFPLDGPEAMQQGDPFYDDIIGWSETPGGAVNYPVGAVLTMQYNVPQKILYAVRSSDEVSIDGEFDGELPPVWSSDDETIVTVDAQTGEVTAVSYGTTYINVEWKGIKKSIPVTVQEALPIDTSLTNEDVNTEPEKGKIPAKDIVNVQFPSQKLSNLDQQSEDGITYYLYDDRWMTFDEIIQYWKETEGTWEDMEESLKNLLPELESMTK